MEELWKGWHFDMIGMKKLQDQSYYHPMVMHVFCLPSAGFVILDVVEYNLILNMFHKICILTSSP